MLKHLNLYGKQFGFEPEQLRDTLIEWLKEDGVI